VDALDLSRLELSPGTFIDEKMKEFRSDLLFRIPAKTGGLSEIYLLFEHKSVPDPRIFQQLLGYLARIYNIKDYTIYVSRDIASTKRS